MSSADDQQTPVADPFAKSSKTPRETTVAKDSLLEFPEVQPIQPKPKPKPKKPTNFTPAEVSLPEEISDEFDPPSPTVPDSVYQKAKVFDPTIRPPTVRSATAPPAPPPTQAQPQQKPQFGTMSGFGSFGPGPGAPPQQQQTGGWGQSAKLQPSPIPPPVGTGTGTAPPKNFDIQWRPLRMDKGNYLSGKDNFDGWYSIVSLWLASHKVTSDNWQTVTEETDLCLGVELAGTMKPEVMNFLNPVSGFQTLYAIKKHFSLRGAVAQQLLMDKLRRYTYRGGSSDGREWSRNFTILVSRLTAAGLVLDDTIQRSILFENVEDSMPEWVDRIRDRLRGPDVPSMVEIHEDFINATVSRQHRQAKARRPDSGNSGSSGSHGKKKDGRKSHNQETTQGSGSSKGSSGGKSKEVKKRKDGSVIRDGDCHKCGKHGHWKSECRSNSESAQAHASAAASYDKPRDEPKYNYSSRVGETGVAALMKMWDDFEATLACGANSNPADASPATMEAEPHGESHSTLDPGEPHSDSRSMATTEPTGEESVEQAPTVMVAQALSCSHNDLDLARRDRWLFDTGADIHTINDAKWYKEGFYTKTTHNIAVSTGGGMCYPTHIGKAELSLVGADKKKKTLLLSYVVLIPKFPLNIFSGEKFYQMGGYLNKDRVTDPSGDVVAIIDVKKRGFHLHLFGSSDTAKNNGGKVPGVMMTAVEEQQLWHRRLGHPSLERLRKTIELTDGIPLDPKTLTDVPCEACDLGLNYKIRSKDVQARETVPGRGLHIDVGMIRPESIQNHKHFVMIVDDATRFRQILFVKQKAQVQIDLVSKIEDITKHMTAFPHWIRLDGGGEYGGRKFDAFADKHSITVAPSAPYCQYQNGTAERAIGVVQDVARRMGIQMGIPTVFWNYILKAAVDLLNTTYTSALKNQNKTPHEAWQDYIFPGRNNRPSNENRRILGARVFIHIEKEKRVQSQKMDPRGWEGILLCYSGFHTYEVWAIEAKKVMVTPNVIFHEELREWNEGKEAQKTVVRSLPEHVQRRMIKQKRQRAEAADMEAPPDEIEPDDSDSASDSDYDTEVEEHPNLASATEPNLASAMAIFATKQQVTLDAPDSTSLTDWIDSLLATITGPDEAAIAGPGDGAPAPEEADVLQGEQWTSDDTWLCHLLGQPDVFPEDWEFHAHHGGSQIKEARQSDKWPQWKTSIFKEIAAVLKRGTFKFLTKDEARKLTPHSIEMLDGKWVLKEKGDSAGKVESLKSRVVVRGFRQRKGIDYNETFASTARSSSWRILLAMAAVHGWAVLQLDFEQAYLSGVPLREKVFMRPFDMLDEYFAEHPDKAKEHGYEKSKILQLLLPLYGLKQAGHNWQEKVREEAGKLGFTPLISDTAVYYNGHTGVILASFVDDFLVFSKKRQGAQSFMDAIAARLSIKDLGEAKWFLGVKIKHSEEAISIVQDAHIRKVLEDTGFADSKTHKTPTNPTTVKAAVPRADHEEVDEDFVTSYASKVGQVIYPACITRPDISFAAGLWARYMAKPSEDHEQGVKRVLRYLKGHQNLGISYTKGGELDLHAYSDSDYAGDKSTAKSTSGFVIFMAGAPVSWGSRRQTTVAQSTAEAEYAAANLAAREIAWIWEFLTELGFAPTAPTPLKVDNEAAIIWSTKDTTPPQKRHVSVAYHYVNEQVATGRVALEYVPSAENAADGFTKGLDWVKHQEFIKMLGLKEIE